MDNPPEANRGGPACLGGPRAGRWVPPRLGVELLRERGWMVPPHSHLTLHPAAVFRLISLLAFFSWGCNGAHMTLDHFMPPTLPGLQRALLTSRVYLEDK